MIDIEVIMSDLGELASHKITKKNNSKKNNSKKNNSKKNEMQDVVENCKQYNK